MGISIYPNPVLMYDERGGRLNAFPFFGICIEVNVESNLYKRLKTATNGFHWQRHEDKLVAGIPDTSYAYDQTCGWIELKTYDNWPSDPCEPLQWKDLKAEQVNWLIARGRKMTHCYILLEVGKDPKTSDWLLIHWPHLRKLNTLTKSRLKKIATLQGKGPISKSIKEVLCL